MKSSIHILISLSLMLTTTLGFGYQYYQRPLVADYEECPTCIGSDWYIGSYPGQSEPRPSKWGQRGFSNTWHDRDFPDEAEQDDISGFERSVYVDHK